MESLDFKAWFIRSAIMEMPFVMLLNLFCFLMFQIDPKMSSAATHGMHTVTVKPCINCSRRTFMPSTVNFSTECKMTALKRLTSSSHISSSQSFSRSFLSSAAKNSEKGVIRAMSGAVPNDPLPGLPIDLRGQTSYNLTCFLFIYWCMT